MTGTILFIHGTGVRHAGYDKLIATVTDQVAGAGIDARVIGVPWGLRLGVSDELVAATLPVLTTRSLETGRESVDLSRALWELLRDDPLVELRIAGDAGGSTTSSVAIGELRSDQQVRQAVDVAIGRLPPDLSYTGVDREEIAQAIARVRNSAELGDAAVGVGSASDPPLLGAVARAAVAELFVRLRASPEGIFAPVLTNATVRDRLVQDVLDALIGDGTRGGPIDWLKDRVKQYALGKATNFVQQRRTSLMSMANLALGDILYYQRRGQAIRDLIWDEMQSLAHPVVAVGHSLGGIALVEVLVEHQDPPIDMLVTVGSQSPLFFAIDALESLRPTGSVAPFEPWLNIYNPADFLSFMATGVFKDRDRVWDASVDPGVPFPESHSAYFHSDEVYQLILERWPNA